MRSLPERRAALVATLGFARLRTVTPALRTLHRWLDSWRGVGDVIAGMQAQGYDAQLQQYPDGWRANFYTTGIAHSIVHGSAYEPTPWRATQRAAWAALMSPVSSSEPAGG